MKADEGDRLKRAHEIGFALAIDRMGGNAAGGRARRPARAAAPQLKRPAEERRAGLVELRYSPEEVQKRARERRGHHPVQEPQASCVRVVGGIAARRRRGHHVAPSRVPQTFEARGMGRAVRPAVGRGDLSIVHELVASRAVRSGFRRRILAGVGGDHHVIGRRVGVDVERGACVEVVVRQQLRFLFCRSGTCIEVVLRRCARWKRQHAGHEDQRLESIRHVPRSRVELSRSQCPALCARC